MTRITKRKWKFTNGVDDIEMCETCRQPIYSGHVDCTCPTNHPDNCDRPTYDQLLEDNRQLREALEAVEWGIAIYYDQPPDATKTIAYRQCPSCLAPDRPDFMGPAGHFSDCKIAEALAKREESA